MAAIDIWSHLFNDVEFFLIAMARAFGFSVLFTPFAWGGLNAGVLRMAFVISISLPLISAVSTVPSMIVSLPKSGLFLLVLKELFLGGVLGWASSKPFEIAAGGGHIIDTYRNATSGDPDPAGGQITAYSKLFLVGTMMLFATVGGFWLIADILYKSYEIWPLTEILPIKPITALGPIISLVSSLIVSAMVIAGPLVIIMLMSDVIFLFAAKFGKSINTFHLAFTVKNLIAICLLPLFLLVFQRFFDAEVHKIANIPIILEQVFK